MSKWKNLLTAQLLKKNKGIAPNPYIWVFSSTENRYYNYNSKYLFEYVKENLPEITPYFVINDDALRKKLGEIYGEAYFIETNTAEGIKKVLGAGVWFTSAGLPVYGTGLGENRLIVNLWHGVPLKRIALMDRNLKRTARVYFRKIFSENYTHILTTSRGLVPVMAKSFGVGEERIRVWGQPRNDGIFVAHDREAILRGLYRDLPEYKNIVLYAPTFRDGGETRLFPFADYDRDTLGDFLEKEKLLIFVRTHVQEKSSANVYLSSRIRYLGVEEAEDITGLLGIFDLLVTDYSSIYIDYLLTGKPMIFLPYDKEEYLDERGMNFTYEKVTPGPKPETQAEFTKALATLLGGEDSYRKERDRVNHFFNEIRRPCALEICRQILKEIEYGESGKDSQKTD